MITIRVCLRDSKPFSAPPGPWPTARRTAGQPLAGLFGLTFSAFNADPGADLLVNFAAGSVRINGLDPVTPSTGPWRIGELLVNAAFGGEVELTSGEVIGADLASELLSPQTLVSVPEPGRLLMLASGFGLLLGLARARAKR